MQNNTLLQIGFALAYLIFILVISKVEMHAAIADTAIVFAVVLASWPSSFFRFDLACRPALDAFTSVLDVKRSHCS